MRLLIVGLAAVFLSACAPWFPAIVADHTSNPFAGYPINHVCDPAEDFLGGAAGRATKTHTRIYMAFGAKRIRQCEGDAVNFGAKLLIIQDFPHH